MKIYARQIPPEYQESPLFMDGYPENVHVYGNRDYKEHGNYYKTVEDINNFSGDLDALRDGIKYASYETLASLLQAYFPREEPYTRQERLRFLDIVATFWEAKEYSHEERTAVLEVMGLRDRIKYDTATIRGCCQSDWQYVIFPAEYGREWLRNFETEYFNTGSAWEVHDESAEPESPEDITGFYCYCHGWSEDQIRKEIAEAYGEPDAEVVLYKFAGFTKIAVYSEV